MKEAGTRGGGGHRKANAETRRRKAEKDLKIKSIVETISHIPVQVKSVEIKGLKSTRDEVVEEILKDVLKAKSYEEVFVATKHAHRKLKSLGCFKRVDGVIDVSPVNSNEMHIIFNVDEVNPAFANLETTTGDNEANLITRIGLANTLGRADVISLGQTIGTHGTKRIEAGIKVPITGYFKSDTNKTANFLVRVFSGNEQHVWSGLKASEAGMYVGAILSPFSWLQQHFNWQLNWRSVFPSELSLAKDSREAEVLGRAQLSPLQLATSTYRSGGPRQQERQFQFSAREMCGHSLASTVSHQLVMDTRDDVVIPKEGSRVTLDQELSGLIGGDVCLFRTRGTFSIHSKLAPLLPNNWSKWLGPHFSVSLSGSAGFLSPMRLTTGHEAELVSTLDRFKLGGPLCMRGFTQNGISCRDSLSASRQQPHLLGALAYWRSCLQLYFPLPYLNRSNTWTSANLRGHAFLEAGSLGNPVSRFMARAMTEPWAGVDNLRASAGVGVVLRLGSRGRAELNYCLPLRAMPGDRLQHGLQIGIGVDFA